MKKTILDNGLTVITNEINSSKSASLGFFVNAGSYQEKSYPLGTAHFVEHMLFKGTKNRDVFQINEEIDEVGGILNAYTTYEQTRYYTLTPFDKWKTGIDIILDLMWNHTIPEEELEKERNVILEEIKMFEDDPTSLIMDALSERMFINAKERQFILGTEESVKSITLLDIKNFIEEFYQPNNLTFVGVGNINHKEILSYIQNYGFSRNKKTKVHRESFTPTSLLSETISFTKDIQQAHLTFGLFAPKITDKDYFTFKILTDHLGGSSSSRLYRLIREERGLAYSVELGYDASFDVGVLQGYVGLEEEKVEEVKNLIQSELFKLSTEKLTEKELNRAINHATGLFMLSLEDNDTLNDFYGRNHFYNLPLSPEEFIENLKKVTSDDILLAAKKFFTKENILFSELLPEEEEDPNDE